MADIAEADPELELKTGVNMIMEMFPSCCQVEGVHCVSMMNSDLDRAVQLLITRAELGQDIKPNKTQLFAKLSKPVEIDDNQLKKRIMSKFRVVDKETYQPYHRPTIL